MYELLDSVELSSKLDIGIIAKQRCRKKGEKRIITKIYRSEKEGEMLRGKPK